MWIISFRQWNSEDWHLIVSIIIGLQNIGEKKRIQKKIGGKGTEKRREEEDTKTNSSERSRKKEKRRGYKNK